ncbi:MAG TPA: TIGR03620 family F420-dependent LLM class oxidoreductase [Gaiellales bacterium]|jgi:probable F420-dependent oxidoreductase
MTIEAADRDALRARLGPVGVWLTLLGLRSAAQERAAAAEIEALGYPALWIGETPVNKEAFVHSGILLAATSEIAIATGIASIYARDPSATNAARNALGEAYGGRFVLGLGVSHAPAVHQRGHDYERPVTAMRGYLDALDSAGYLAPAPEHPVPLVLAALRRRMLELARDRTHGAHPYLVTPGHSARARAVLGSGPVLAPEQGVVLETDPGKARAVAREHLTNYMRLPNYTNSWREDGFGDADFADGGSDRLVDALIAWGDADAIAERVRAHHAAGADHVCIQPVIRDLDRAMAELRALAPVLLAPAG